MPDGGITALSGLRAMGRPDKRNAIRQYVLNSDHAVKPHSGCSNTRNTDPQHNRQCSAKSRGGRYAEGKWRRQRII
ncbi:hypothetical protein EOQ21_15840 [Salmonella bongori serovar 48:i:-]|nr:hypothetical protein [Salmonella bongori serovar 48:i:-]